MGSAVLMRAGDHLFALTAEHCTSDEMQLAFPLGDGQKPGSRILTAHKSPPLDIAVLELEDRPDVLACHIEQLCIDLPIPAGKDTDPATVPIFWVVGYPYLMSQFTGNILSAPKEVFGTNIVIAATSLPRMMRPQMRLASVS
jgi:hypothetical protein